MNRVQSSILERQTVEHDFNPTVYHYVKRVDISRSAALNKPSKSLCGDRRVFSNPIGGRPVDATQGRTICPLCQLVFDTLPNRVVSTNG